MIEKSATAVQTATSQLPLSAATPESLVEKMNRLYDNISRRAFEIFETEGRIDGHDVEHWLKAEREFLFPVQVQTQETSREFTVRAEVPGFTASDIEVSVEPRRLTITGKRESKREDKQGDTVYTEQSSDEIFRIVDLPTEVNTKEVAAVIKDGFLDIRLPKAETTTPVQGASKAA